jgi:hypothetical protein
VRKQGRWDLSWPIALNDTFSFQVDANGRLNSPQLRFHTFSGLKVHSAVMGYTSPSFNADGHWNSAHLQKMIGSASQGDGYLTPAR